MKMLAHWAELNVAMSIIEPFLINIIRLFNQPTKFSIIQVGKV